VSELPARALEVGGLGSEQRSDQQEQQHRQPDTLPCVREPVLRSSATLRRWPSSR
jgi:hypothetical protein